jgi:hypothetical protein
MADRIVSPHTMATTTDRLTAKLTANRLNQ